MRSLALAGAGLLALCAQAQAHQCYRRIVEPPRYTMVEEQVRVSPARDVEEYVPAVTRQVEETVLVRSEETVTHIVPAQYGLRDEAVEVSPAHREWRVRDEGADVIGCWVNVPPRFARVAHRVLIAPAREVSETIPEVTATKLRTEIVEPAHVVTHSIPARYATRQREALAAPGGARWAPIADCER